MSGSSSDLWEGFINPPDAARPRAWWHWMDGNVDIEGMRSDLQWLHSVGVRGVQTFDGALGNPVVVPEPVVPGTEPWREAILAATATARELGLEFTVATSAGWSASGAPWVHEDDAMRKLVWSQTIVDGGELANLAPLPDIAGPFQDIPRWGSEARSGSGFVKDFIALAIPYDKAHDALIPSGIDTSDGPMEQRSKGSSASEAGVQRLARDPDRFSQAWVTQRFADPVTIRSCVIVLPGPHGFGAAPPVSATLQMCDDHSGSYVDVVTFPVTQCPSRTASFAPVHGTHFRLLLSAAGISEVLGAFEKGVRPPPVFKPLEEFIVSEFTLYESGMPAHREAKSGFSAAPDYDVLHTDPRSSYATVAPGHVIDLSDSVSAGRLIRPLPEGRWRVIRFGSSLTGQKNGPALEAATGLEVDKLDAERVRAYITRHLHQFGTATVDALLSDSIEAGFQNITDKLADQFHRLRGYALTPWLLAVAGFQIASSPATDLFLGDFRRTIAEVFAEAYYGTLSEEAHKRGAIYYAEALEDRRPQLGDDLAMRSHADVPMGAMWTFDSKTGPAPTYVADLKGASSVAHVYGRERTGSEAFTSGRNPWSDSPKSLKHIADLQLVLGVTRFCIHASPHQPSQVPLPGMAMAPSLGQTFTRNETWADSARPWIDYLARCSHLLSLGRPAVDVAFYIGEEAPVTGLYGETFNEVVPQNYDYDYIGPDGLAEVLKCSGGVLHAGSSEYRLLYLGGASDRMTTKALTAVLQLLEDGATVVGIRPTGTRSLADDGLEHKRLCDEIWGPAHQDRVHATKYLDGVLEKHFPPVVTVHHEKVRRIARWVAGSPLVFLANPHDEPLQTSLVFSTGDAQLVAWDPVTLDRYALEPVSGGKAFELSLPPYGSVFVLPGEAARQSKLEQSVQIAGTWTLRLPGAAPIQGPDAAYWTDLSQEVRYFSGTASYRFEFELPGTVIPEAIGFGDIADLAHVVVNGQDCGTIWTAPFRVAGQALHRGWNEIELRVTNTWKNQLIAEGRNSSHTLFEPMGGVFTEEAEILPAGVSGPVSLIYAHDRPVDEKPQDTPRA